MCVCCSGFDNSMYVDLYDGNDDIVTKMVEANFAARSSVSPDMVQLRQSFDNDVPSTDEPKIVSIPG